MDLRDEAGLQTTPDPTLERLPRSRAALERWFRTTPAILHSIDSKGLLIAVSDAWLDKFGYRRDEALGRRSTDFLTPASRDYAIREVAPEFYRTGRRDNVEYQMVCKDGRVLDILLSAVLDPGDEKSGGCSLAVITDITELKQAKRRLAESEALYKGIVESQTELVSLASPDGELRFVNQAYAQLHDRRPRDLIGTSLLDYVPLDLRESVREQLRRVCVSKLGVESENQVVLPDGQRRWLAWTNRAVTDSEGLVTAIHSVGRDIERRVVAEQRVKASEARYRLLAEHSSDLVMLARYDGLRKYVSPASLKLLGWTPEEMLAMTAEDTIHPEDFAKVWSALTGALDGHVTVTHRMRRKDGVYIWVEAASQRVEIVGEPPHRLSVIRDIERRVQGERRIKESEAAYRLLADNSSDMVFQLDRDLVRLYVSPASRDILGYAPSELIGLKPVERCHPDDAERVAAAFRSLLAGEVERQSVINRRLHRDGRWIWVEAQLKAVKDPATGAVSGIVGALRDISLRKAVEDELAEANRRLEILATVDGLTGLPNRRAFDEAFVKEHLRAARENNTLALIMIDVDRFKSFNDRYGHPAGDQCLAQVARAIAATIRRSSDMAARYGGEEFVVLLPNTDDHGAGEVAERIRLAVRSLALENDAGVDGIVTISAGFSATRNAREMGVERLLKDADEALYRAKSEGRDRVVNAERPPAFDAPSAPRHEREWI